MISLSLLLVVVGAQNLSISLRLTPDPTVFLTFLLNANVGTPAQSLNFLFDTASPFTTVRSSRCLNAQCKGNQIFDDTKSSTLDITGSQNVTAVSIDGVQLNGVVSRDTVSLGAIAVKSSPLILATSVGLNLDNAIDGVLSMIDSTNDSASTFWSSMDRQLTNRVFGFSLDDDPQQGGWLDLGFYNKSRMYGTPVFYDSSPIPLPENISNSGLYWTLRVSKISVGSQALSFSGTAIVDTALSLTALPASILQQIVQVFSINSGDWCNSWKRQKRWDL
jgi:Eukaryotic aspartyl protease